jgi:hypothetical protein
MKAREVYREVGNFSWKIFWMSCTFSCLFSSCILHIIGAMSLLSECPISNITNIQILSLFTRTPAVETSSSGIYCFFSTSKSRTGIPSLSQRFESTPNAASAYQLYLSPQSNSLYQFQPKSQKGSPSLPRTTYYPRNR